MTTTAMPYPMLDSVASTADQNPSWHTDRVVVEGASFNLSSWSTRVCVASKVDIHCSLPLCYSCCAWIGCFYLALVALAKNESKSLPAPFISRPMRAG